MRELDQRTEGVFRYFGKRGLTESLDVKDQKGVLWRLSFRKCVSPPPLFLFSTQVVCGVCFSSVKATAHRTRFFFPAVACCFVAG